MHMGSLFYLLFFFNHFLKYLNLLVGLSGYFGELHYYHFNYLSTQNAVLLKLTLFSKFSN